MEARFDFPESIKRVTGEKGSESLLVFGSEKTALMDPGMAFAHKALIDNIKSALAEKGRSALDYIFISHSHYDHVGALPYVLAEWPDAKVCAAEKTKRVFASDGAKETMRRLSKVAAALYGSGDCDPDMEKLRVDLVVRDGDSVSLGNERIAVLETKGHTDCSLTFVLEPAGIMFASESTGVIRSGKVSSEIVKSYKDAVESALKCINYKPKRLIIPHYGLYPDDQLESFFYDFIAAAAIEKDTVVRAFRKEGTLEGTLVRFKEEYWKDEYVEGQPREAFDENAKYIVKNILKEEGLI